MWGGSPLASTKPAFLFLLSHASLPTTLPVSFFRFLLCRLMLGLTQVVCFAEQGTPQLVSAVLPSLSLRLLAWEKRLPVAQASATLVGWGGGAVFLGNPQDSYPVGCRDKIGRLQWLLTP